MEPEDYTRASVSRSRGPPAVVVYTLVKPELREAMRALCRRARVHYCDLLGHPIEAVARVSGIENTDIETGGDLRRELAERRPGDTVQFALRRGGGVELVAVTLGDRPDRSS